MIHESKLHPANSFVTLTYDDAHLPADGSISKRALQLFLKRLRIGLDRGSGPSVRYFGCGEYGDRRGRPHYHVIVFGWFPGDARTWRQQRGNVTYRSAFLETVWPFGQVETGRVTPQSCGYVARYAMKKLTGDRADEFYRRPHPLTGVVYQVMPEFGLMSRRPGLGSGWFDKYHMDAFPSDFLIVDGKKRNVPSFYKKKLAGIEAVRLLQERRKAARTPQRLANSTDARLTAREGVATLREAQLKRDLE